MTHIERAKVPMLTHLKRCSVQREAVSDSLNKLSTIGDLSTWTAQRIGPCNKLTQFVKMVRLWEANVLKVFGHL